MLRIVGLLLVMAACWRDASPPPPPLRPDPAAPADRPSERIAWSGTCGDEESGWREAIAVTLAVREESGEIIATGTLAFVDRRARARLRGPREGGPRQTLHGEMTEIGGLGTRWGLILEVEPGPTGLRGRFLEVLDAGGEEEMCRFAWRR
jgi:hypothetical protein